MDFQALCEFTAEEVNGRPLTFSSIDLSSVTDPFQRRVIKAVQGAYMDIQHYSEHWKFLNSRGAILSLVSGTNSYTLASNFSILPVGLYTIKSGETARFPIYVQNYPWWKYQEQLSPSVTGQPQYLIESDTPDTWLVWPIPVANHTLYGDQRTIPIELALLTSEPVWDERYHEMVAWLAIKHLEKRVKTRDEVVSALNSGEAADRFNARWSTFCSEYAMAPTGAAPLF